MFNPRNRIGIRKKKSEGVQRASMYKGERRRDPAASMVMPGSDSVRDY
jgi:hypothetical protein